MPRITHRLPTPLPAQLLPLPRAQWTTSQEYPEAEITGGLRVRCGMRDCRPDLGRIIRIRLADGYDWHEYQAPPGFVFREESVEGAETPVFAWSERAAEQRRRGGPLIGRRPHRARGDWRRTTLGPREMPAMTYGLGYPGQHTALVVLCTRCPRKARVTLSEALAALASALWQ